MTSFSRVGDFWADRRAHHWCQWAVMSLGFVSGCASWNQVSHTATQPLRATGNFLARKGDQVGDLFELHSTRHRNPANLPASQGLTPARPGSAEQMASLQKVPKATALTQVGADKPAAEKPSTTQAIHDTPYVKQVPQESRLTPLKPSAVELLPAPPAVPHSANNSQPASTEFVTTAAANATISNWCRVRIRNISPQTVPQVAVTVNSPENARLVSKDGDSVSEPVAGKLEFAPVAQVGSREEVVLVIGLVTSEQRGSRLRVQVRDGLGGSNQEVQSRWNVTIEAIEASPGQ